nr:MAG TPA: major capsid protein [Caudoviricetes sp.]
MNMKKKLETMLQKKEARKGELVERSKTSEDVVELRSIHAEMEGLNDEITELRGMLSALQDETPQGTPPTPEEPQARSFNPIATYSLGNNQQIKRNQEEDIYSTVEYRMAFMNYVTKGTPIPEEFRMQLDESRSNELTVVGDVAAVIPTNLLNKVIEDITVEGKILARVTQTSYKGGVEIPISEINPVATWLNDEKDLSDEQKGKMEAKVTFSYHVLEAKVALGLLTATVSLPIFEATIVKQLKKAMLRSIEESIVEGSGSGKPLGFTKLTLPEDQVVEFTEDTIGTVKQWAEAEAAIPEAHEDAVIYLMSKKTWEKYLNGMTDASGQKIGLGKINEKGQKIINGREVLVTDRFLGFDKCGEGDIFGAIVDLSQYMLNSNLAMYYKRYFNEDTNKWIHKALMIVDGKMAAGNDSTGKLVGAEGLIYLKKSV